jgi:hypothetical protein
VNAVGRLVGREEAQVKRFLLLLAATAAVIAVAFPATAGAATFRGVVIAKDSARKALVTASPNGTIRTVRLHAGFNRLGVGRVVAVRAAKLPDGTFSASSVRRLGKAGQARVAGTIVTRMAARLVLSAGGSVFALRLSGKAGQSAGGSLGAGDRVRGKASIRGGALQSRERDLKKTGHDGRLELEGIYLDTAEDGTIELAVVHRGRVFVHVPEGMEVPAFAPGDEIALVVTVEADGSFTLVKAENEDDDDGDEDGGIDDEKKEFSVVGILASVTAEAVAVKVEGHIEPVRCDVPDEFDLAGFAAGQKVYMTCKYDEGHFVLVALKQKEAPPSGEYFSVEGTISTLDSSQVSVEVVGHEEPVTCKVPPGTDLLGFAAGDQVKMYCWKKDGNFVLKALISDHASISPDGSWFIVEGVITELNSLRISLEVDGHPSPVTCKVAEGADLSGFAVGDAVTMKCKQFDGGFKLKLLESDTAHYELT